MVRFTAAIRQFEEQGEKTGWTYIDVPQDIAQQLRPGTKTSFRVKGKLDKHPISGVALLPMGAGAFIIPLNAEMRRAIAKKKGAMLDVQLAVDTKPLEPPPGFFDCLADEPEAQAFYESLKLSHRNYYIKWMCGVKSEAARAKRIAQAITALSRGQNYVEMVRSAKARKG